MKNKTKTIIGLLSILVCITGCGKVAKLENGQDAVVKLKGKDISVDSLYNEMKDKYALSVLLDMIDTQILNDKYKDTEEQEKSIESQISTWTTQFGSEQQLLQKTTSAWGISTIDALKEYLKLQYKRNTAIEDYSKSLVTDDEINTFYEEKIFGDISAKHILISPKTTNNMTDDEKKAAEEEALKKAKEIITKLNNGEDFETLAKENSDDEATASKGGKLSDFTYGTMDTEFEEAAKKLENGKYTTEPVKTTYGYHIIYKISQKDKPKLKVVKDDIIEDIAKEKLSNDSAFQVTALEELRKEYKIDIQDKTLKTQYENYLTNAKNNTSNS